MTHLESGSPHQNLKLPTNEISRPRATTPRCSPA
jgi:hypothetical protein